jgi:hypothetical protein
MHIFKEHNWTKVALFAASSRNTSSVGQIAFKFVTETAGRFLHKQKQ